MTKFLTKDLTLTALSEVEIEGCVFQRSIEGSTVYRTESELQYLSEKAHGIITVPAGFLTDLASIPKVAQGIFMLHDDPVILKPSVIHDFLYGNKGRINVTADDLQMPVLLTRQECDSILCHEAMLDCGALLSQVDLVYGALRVFGDSWGIGYPLVERFVL